eukprot:jgi/Chlat1/4724/Chrsp30S00370
MTTDKPPAAPRCAHRRCIQVCPQPIRTDIANAVSIITLAVALPDIVRSIDNTTHQSCHQAVASNATIASRGHNPSDMNTTRQAEVDELSAPLDELSLQQQDKVGAQPISPPSVDDDAWRLIFARLPVDNFPALQLVCRQWRRVAGDEHLWRDNFVKASCAGRGGAGGRVCMLRWELRGVEGYPSHPSFWFARGAERTFAIAHTVKHGDTLARIAVRYGVDVAEVKRHNMLMSDHALHSRARVLIPVRHANDIAGKVCSIELDPHSRREFALLSDSIKHVGNTLDGDDDERELSEEERQHARRELMDKLRDTLVKSLRVESAVADYYLQNNNGDLRAAYAEYLRDKEWERQQGQKLAGATSVAALRSGSFS